jgi:hypothetical protein
MGEPTGVFNERFAALIGDDLLDGPSNNDAD